MSAPTWNKRGKTVAALIEELRSFEHQDMEVRISFDGGDTSVPISLVVGCGGKYALLMNCEDVPSIAGHR